MFEIQQNNVSSSNSLVEESLLLIQEACVQFLAEQIKTWFSESFVFYLLTIMLPNSAQAEACLGILTVQWTSYCYFSLCWTIVLKI